MIQKKHHIVGWRQCIYQHHPSLSLALALALALSPIEREHAINEEKKIDHPRAAVLGLGFRLSVLGSWFGGWRGRKDFARSLIILARSLIIIIAEQFRV
jgi:hypothetical protein